MNLGGTEKALLSFINALDSSTVAVTLVLLEGGGQLFDQIPLWVDVQILTEFEAMKPLIFNPPLDSIKADFRKLKIFLAFRKLFLYSRVKITGNWYLNYELALKNAEIKYRANVAIAFAGPSDFISFYVYKMIESDQKIQWIHFDVRRVIYSKNFGNKYYSYFDKIFCVSENAKIVFDEMFPQYTYKTTVFKNIISKKELEALAVEGETFLDGYTGLRILTLGRLSLEKGQQMIPNIVLKLKNENYKFKWYLIGEGVLGEELKTQVKNLKIEKELVMLGAKINPYHFVKDCDIYVQTSYHEGYCLTVHEAKIFNKPVIVTNVASATNLIVNNEDGLIVNINEDAIFDAVKLLIEQNDLRIQFSKNILAQETVSEIEKLVLPSNK